MVNKYKRKYVPYHSTSVADSTIVIDFGYYNDQKCELEKISKTGVVKKMLRFIKQVGQCQEGSELQQLLKSHNSCDMSLSSYQKLAPEGLKIYEVWHKKNCAERIFYSRAGSTFYPILFLQTH